MKEGRMTREEVNALLDRAAVGRVTTLGADGWPYTVAVHFVRMGEKVYFHGLPRGEKLSNLTRDDRVCFETDELTAILDQGIDSPCSADAAYESAVVWGRAGLVTEEEKKEAVLRALIRKYVPAAGQMPMKEESIRGTAVVEVTPVRVTGKRHRGN